MSSSISAIGVAPIQPVPPIVYQPPEEGIAPVEASASAADESGSGGPDVLYERGPQWPAQPLTYSNASVQAADPEQPGPSDAIFDPDDAVSWATQAAEKEAAEPVVQAPLPDAPEPLETPEPLATAEPLPPLEAPEPLAAAVKPEATNKPAETPEWLAENGAAPVLDTPDALDGGAMLAQELLDAVLSNEALYPIEAPDVPVEAPDPTPVAASGEDSAPADETVATFANPVDDASWQPDYVDVLGAHEVGETQAAPVGSDEAILAAIDNGGTAPAAVPASVDAPPARIEAAPASVEKRSFDAFAQAAVASGPQAQSAQAAAMVQAAYEQVARASGDSPIALDLVKLA